MGRPVGVDAGRWTWQLFVGRLGAEANVLVPLAVVLLGVPVVIALANLIAAGPGWAAGRLHPAAVLRSE